MIMSCAARGVKQVGQHCLRRKKRCSGCDEKVKGVILDMSWEVDMLD